MVLLNKYGLRQTALALLVCGFGMPAWAQGYRDVMPEALVNPSFELSAEAPPLTAATATNIAEAYG